MVAQIYFSNKLWVSIRHTVWKFGEDETSNINGCLLCKKILRIRNKIKRRSITCSHIWHVNTSKYVVLIRHTFYKSLMKICAIKHKCHSFLWYYFSDIRQCCRPAQKNILKNQKSDHDRMISIKIRNFRKYSRPLHKLL